MYRNRNYLKSEGMDVFCHNNLRYERVLVKSLDPHKMLCWKSQWGII